MKILPYFQEQAQTHIGWRHSLHGCAQTGFEEVFASQFVTEKLKSWGFKVTTGIAKTGVVGTLEGKNPGQRVIGLRADMDALDIEEHTNLPYCSSNSGKMHACGHDGHTTTLLAAAEYLSKNRNFSGTVHFIFQPAEEGLGGARKMIEEGLFKKFPCQNVYALHNWPDLPVGQAGLRPGPIMAAADRFTLEISGRGGHGGFPHQVRDAVLCSAHVITALQSIVSRNLHPLDSGVISVGSIHAGEAFNVIPETVRMLGTTRSFKPEVRQALKAGILRVAQGVAKAFEAEVSRYDYEDVFDPTVNDDKSAAFCEKILTKTLGEGNVDNNLTPTMASEDFGGMLMEVPGCYILLGCKDDNHTAKLHSPHYDFNDKIIPIGASYWVNLVETAMAA